MFHRSLVLVLVSCASARSPAPATPPPTAPPVKAQAAEVPNAPAALRDKPEKPAEPRREEPARPQRPALSSRIMTTWIWEKPSFASQMIGFFRAGSRVPAEPYEGKDADAVKCKWYKLDPGGFVCDGAYGVTSNLEDPVVVAAARHPFTHRPLPYGYGMSTGAALYTRVPTEKDQKDVEGDVEGWKKRNAELRAKLPPDKQPPPLAMPLGPLPPFLDGHAQVPPILPGVALTKAARGGYADYAVRLAFLSAFESDGRAFYLTTEHLVVPADRVHAAKLSDFRGVELRSEKLPMVWVRLPSDKTPVNVYRLEGDTVTKLDVVLPEKAHAEVAEDDVIVKGQRYHELRAVPANMTRAPGVKLLVKAGEATRLDAVKEMPAGVKPGETWLDVNLTKQTMVVYEGTTPVYVTLISSGAGGKNHNTPWGAFRIYQKHLSSRMSAEAKPPEKEGEQGEHAYRFDDVPWVQYVVGGIAIHTAFWHDGFGLPRSHGCINLSPIDAQYVFGKTEPKMPEGWHGVSSNRGGVGPGTMVHIHG